MKRERKSEQEKAKNKGTAGAQKRNQGKKGGSYQLGSQVSKKTKYLWVLIISILTLVAYYPTLDNEITSWDDEFYITNNPYLKDLSAENVGTLLNTDTYYMGNYHPLAMISLSIDYAIGGEDENGNIDPFMYHFTNILLHLITSLLVFWFVLGLLKNFNVAVLAGVLFGVHTLHVESVAWISERKDVLYAMFFLASLVSYVKYVDTKKLTFYILALLLFVFSLLSKGQAVSLAVTLIIIDYFRERKLISQRVIIEKLPFLILAVIFGMIAIGAQQESEALVDERSYSLMQRIGIASYAFMQYVFKLILPINLSAIYPYPDIIGQTIPALFYFMILPVIFIGWLFFWLLRKSKKVLVFGIAFFIINIALLLQFIPVGSAVHADRYAYIPSIGFYIIASVLIIRFTEKKESSRQIIFGITGLYIALLTILSFQRSEVWANSESLWDDTVEKSPKSVIAWNNRGSLFDRKAASAMEELKFEEAEKFRNEAINNFTNAIIGKPDYKNAFYNRGVSSFELGKMKMDTLLISSSVSDFDNALKQDAQFSDAYHQRANAKAELGQFEAAIKDFNLAIDLKPADFNYYANRGVTKGKMGNVKGAIEDFNKGLELNPNESALYSNRGRAKMLNNDISGAIEDYNIAIQIEPNHYTAYFNRGLAKNSLKDSQGAIEDLNRTIQINPNMQDAFYWRAIIYLGLNNTELACPDLKRAYDMGIQNAGQLIEQYCK